MRRYKSSPRRYFTAELGFTGYQRSLAMYFNYKPTTEILVFGLLEEKGITIGKWLLTACKGELVWNRMPMSSSFRFISDSIRIPREETLNGKRQKHLKENKRQKVRNQELCPSREIRNLTTFTRLMDYNNGFSISSFFLSLLSSLWIGAQFPQEKFLSYGRILTLDFYFLLMCILFLLLFLFFFFFLLF